MNYGTRFACFSAALTGLLAAPVASAHVRLTDPPPRLDGRDGGNELKIGPCGQAQNARTTTVTEFTGGETITVAFGEYIDHPSYYRIALDVDGDDSFPNRPEEAVQQEGDDPESVHPVSDIADTSLDVYILQYYLDDGSGGFMQETSYTTEVTLPNIDCQNCTLQLLQFMYNDDEPHYYQCADITITASAGDSTTGAGGTTATTGTMGAGGGMAFPTTTGTLGSTTGAGTTTGSVTTGSTSSTASASATASSTASASTTSGSTTSASTTNTASMGAATTASPTTGTTGFPSQGPTGDDEAEAGGCSFRAVPNASRGSWLGALLGLGLLGYRRRPKPER
ncbi:MAG TPA: SCE4755 family polysaccharide monooxygenase-like protein [Polyangiaceae bacterium]|nr:SCE4755 family polysaccharide monooxygenase-like protein [Polyangiaceae bacterium]